MQTKFPPPIIVKFYDREDFFRSLENYVDDVFSKAPPHWQAQWKSILQDFPGISIKRLFRRVNPHCLTALSQQAARMDLAYLQSNPPNLLTFFVVEYPDSYGAEKILRLLNVLRIWRELVETAYLDPKTRAPNITLDTKMQNYLKPAIGKGGIDALAAWNIEGADGANQILIDFESGWKLTHPDLPANIGPLIGGVQSNDAAAINHGTGMLGIICARDNVIGCVGITPNLKTIELASWMGPTGPLSRADVISETINLLPYGGVLLIEAELGAAEITDGPPVEGYPIETMAADFAVIQKAAARGISVIAAAGNGNKTIVANPSKESGATLVAAAESPVKAEKDKPESGNVVDGIYAPKRLPCSNYGSRVNCYAWGQGVMTLQSDNDGYGEVGMTSAAAAIVAGTALSVQGMIHAKFNVRIDGKRLRDILGHPMLGTISQSGQQIGVMPNLLKFIDRLPILELPPHVLPITDLYLRDFDADDGDPLTAPASQDAAFSPDMIVKANEQEAPKNSFGDLLIQQGQAYQIKLRVWNRGVEPSTQVLCQLYLWKGSPGNAPHQLTPLGSVEVQTVAPNRQTATLSGEVQWSVDPATQPGAYYLVGLVDKGIDDHKGLAPYHDKQAIEAILRTTPLISLQRRVAEINNLAWHRVQITSP